MFLLRADDVRTIAPWRDYFHNPQGPLLGVFNAIQTIGGLVGLPFTPYMADRLGRRGTLAFGLICSLHLAYRRFLLT